MSELATPARERAEAAVTRLVGCWYCVADGKAMLESSRHQALEAHLTARTLWQRSQCSRTHLGCTRRCRDDSERTAAISRTQRVVEEMQGGALMGAATHFGEYYAEADAALAGRSSRHP